MTAKVTYGVGAHEPIWHRLRTGNSTAEEWQRWQRETSSQNLDLLQRLGVTHAHIACSKGFGLEYEKPLIERAARFAEAAARRGIATSIYVQGFPIYYETFFLELPAAEGWLARGQDGGAIPWGGQTFRRWIDPTRKEFHEYEWRLLEYVLRQFTPSTIYMDNTVAPPCWSESCRESFRAYLRRKYASADLVREFGIPSFDAVDLPRFDPIYFPPDAYRIVKDPLLQEWARWRSAVMAEFLDQTRRLIQSIAPEARFCASAGCDGLRYNHLFVHGVDFEDLLAAVEVGMEESGWRPGAFEASAASGKSQAGRKIVMDERIALGSQAAQSAAVRVSTDSRWMKICTPYGKSGGGGFWGEIDRDSKLVALAHNFAFTQHATHLGTIGPLAAPARMFEDVADAIEWARAHAAVLSGREERIAPLALWRGTSTLAFIRHRPVWEACAVEQMLYEHHLPFTILLDGGLERFLDGREALILPGTECVSDRQAEIITQFVESGGSLLLLGPAGTRDERTRLRQRYAFEHLFAGGIPELEYFGPPHWVPELNFSAMPERLEGRFGRGRVVLVKRIVPPAALDLSRDPYMPERQVMPKDILPPANEEHILAELMGLLGDVPRVEGPRWVLCEFWKRGRDLLICCANLRQGGAPREGELLTVHLGRYRAGSARVHSLFEDRPAEVALRDGRIELPAPKRFCAIELIGALGEPKP